MSHSNVDEAVATEAVDVATLVAENASLRDRLLRALADAENTRRRAASAAAEAREIRDRGFCARALGCRRQSPANDRRREPSVPKARKIRR